MAVTRKGRANETRSFESYLATERSRIFDRASKQRKEMMLKAEQSRKVYEAWNRVLDGTRESKHVTGLKYLVESNELLVYLDAAAWTQELVLMREIVRTRMENEGVKLNGLKFRTSREGYASKRKQPFKQVEVPRVQKVSAKLSATQERAIEEQTSVIVDKKLKNALQNAMKASARLSAAKQIEK